MPMSESAVTRNISVVLVGTLQPGNIGSVARAMKTMGLSSLRLAAPQCRIDARAEMMATHAVDVLQAARVYPTFADAVADAGFIVGTTARDRRHHGTLAPDTAAQRLVQAAAANRAVVVFGPEDCGLHNDHLTLCDELIAIPTVPEATSLNISHAVMIVCWEMFRQVQTCPARQDAPRRAPSSAIEAMYAHMRRALLDIGYLNPQNPDLVMGHFRRIFSRAGLTAREVATIRGIFRQLRWFTRRRTGTP